MPLYADIQFFDCNRQDHMNQRLKQQSQPSVGLVEHLFIYPVWIRRSPDSPESDVKKASREQGELTRFGIRVDTAISSETLNGSYSVDCSTEYLVRTETRQCHSDSTKKSVRVYYTNKLQNADRDQTDKKPSTECMSRDSYIRARSI